MDGSDDDFFDLDDDVDTVTGSTPPALSDDSPPGTITPSTAVPQTAESITCSATNIVNAHQSPVPIPDTPSDVFELFFS